MAEELPDGFVPPIYKVGARWEIWLWLYSGLFILWMVWPLMMGPVFSDMALFAIGPTAIHYLITKVGKDNE